MCKRCKDVCKLGDLAVLLHCARHSQPLPTNSADNYVSYHTAQLVKGGNFVLSCRQQFFTKSRVDSFGTFLTPGALRCDFKDDGRMCLSRLGLRFKRFLDFHWPLFRFGCHRLLVSFTCLCRGISVVYGVFTGGSLTRGKPLPTNCYVSYDGKIYLRHL